MLSLDSILILEMIQAKQQSWFYILKASAFTGNV